eukprot:CAMPEP_0197055596 /NCGR_PEP_ID=MMETSP1384-20130603/69009_1 /TAXON_ID=29189 /ORGANISM="Ammonia sp." /LENGTH=232 /DNA_ID=CAMNT_0042489223 /DNA_START=105 /DNA_END=803 /DNA_ORIENTATION=-
MSETDDPDDDLAPLSDDSLAISKQFQRKKNKKKKKKCKKRKNRPDESESDNDDDDDDDDDYNPALPFLDNDLLKQPLTKLERKEYSGLRLKLLLKHNRTKGDNPTAYVNVSSWQITKLLEDVNGVLARFGAATTYTDYTLCVTVRALVFDRLSEQNEHVGQPVGLEQQLSAMDAYMQSRANELNELQRQYQAKKQQMVATWQEMQRARFRQFEAQKEQCQCAYVYCWIACLI